MSLTGIEDRGKKNGGMRAWKERIGGNREPKVDREEEREGVKKGKYNPEGVMSLK